MESKIWNVISLVDEVIIDGEGNEVVIPAGSLINRITWDGISEWTPPENTRLELVEK